MDFAWLVQHLAARYGGRVPALRVSADEARARAELGLAPGPLDAALDRAHAWYARFRYLPQSPPKDAS